MLDRTGSLILLQHLLGHESVTIIQRYVHPEAKGLAGMVNDRNAPRHTLWHTEVAIQE